MLTRQAECQYFLIATESTEGHGKVSNGRYVLPCFSVDSVAIISVIIKMKNTLVKGQDIPGRSVRAAVTLWPG